MAQPRRLRFTCGICYRGILTSYAFVRSLIVGNMSGGVGGDDLWFVVASLWGYSVSVLWGLKRTRVR